jgi:aldose 1-epimerase
LLIFSLDYNDYKNLNNTYYFGCIVGRVTNRVEKGKFTLNNQEYHIQKNETSKHAEHGGKKVYIREKKQIRLLF